MQTARPYELKERIFRLCCKEDYFNCGTNQQYDMMFSMAVMPEMSVRDIAVMIFTCTEKASLGRILSDLQEIVNGMEAEDALKKGTLNAEWVPYMKAYRLYDPHYPQQTVAYVDSIEEAEAEHPEYRYVEVDADTMHVECY